MMNKYWREYSEIGAILWTDRSEEEDVNAGMRGDYLKVSLLEQMFAAAATDSARIPV